MFSRPSFSFFFACLGIRSVIVRDSHSIRSGNTGEQLMSYSVVDDKCLRRGAARWQQLIRVELRLQRVHTWQRTKMLRCKCVYATRSCPDFHPMRGPTYRTVADRWTTASFAGVTFFLPAKLPQQCPTPGSNSAIMP